MVEVLNFMKTFPKPLSTKEEQKYLIEFKKGNITARNILIEKNLRLVARVAKKYSLADMDFEDIMSIGTIGLIKAIDTFEMDKNIRLATYASRCIENELLMMFRNEKKLSREVYINESIHTDSSGNVISLLDVIESNDVDIVERLEVEDNVRKLYTFIRELNSREKYIIFNRYGLAGKNELTQREIAKKLGISRSYVSRIEKKALLKLKKKFNNTQSLLNK